MPVRSLWSIVAAVLGVSTLVAQAPSPGRLEFTDPAGDVVPIEVSDGSKYPGFDVVKLVVESGGGHLTVTATLKSPPGPFASDVVELYLDTDNSTKTGATLANPELPGFEYRAQLDACVKFSDSSSTCAGGSATSAAKATAHYAIVRLDRFKGPKEFAGFDPIVDGLGFAPGGAAPQTDTTGAVVKATLDYGAVKVKAGRTIRVLARESAAGTSHGAVQGFFPEARLTLQ